MPAAAPAFPDAAAASATKRKAPPITNSCFILNSPSFTQSFRYAGGITAVILGYCRRSGDLGRTTCQASKTPSLSDQGAGLTQFESFPFLLVPILPVRRRSYRYPWVL